MKSTCALLLMGLSACGRLSFSQVTTDAEGVDTAPGLDATPQCIAADDWPAPRRGSMVVFDQRRGELIVHGGFLVGTVDAVGETYAFDGAGWHQRTTTGPAFQSGALGYSPVDNVTVLAGGFFNDEQIRTDQTWLWNGTSWMPGAPRDRVHRGSSFGFDSDANVLLYIQGADGSALGTTAQWSAGVWSAEATMAKNFESVQAWDPSTRRMISFGGLGALPLDHMESRVAVEPSWTAMTPPTKPPGRRAHTMGTDFQHNQVVLYGGNTQDGALLDDTWLWNGTTWQQAFPTLSPGYYGKMVWDSVRQRLLMFVETSADESHSELWTWTGSTWQQLPRC